MITNNLQGMVNPRIITIAILLKLLLMIAVLFIILSVYHLSMIPAMRDQFMYLSDIQMIMNDITFVTIGSEHYESHNTFYARMVGLFARLIPFGGVEPIIPAVIINNLLQIGIAASVTVYYQNKGGYYPTVLFLLLLFSPTISAYSFFALRDIAITLLFVLFVIKALENKYHSAIVLILLITLLRPLYFSYALYVVLLIGMLKIYENVSQKAFFAFFTALAILAMGHGLVVLLGFEWIYKTIQRDSFTMFRFMTSSLGYGIFFITEDVNLYGHGAGTSKVIRFLMIDSMFISVLGLFSSYKLMMGGASKNKVLGIITIFLVFTLSFAYLVLAGNFPFRKLLPLVPLFYLVIFLYINMFMDNKLNAQKRVRNSIEKRDKSNAEILPNYVKIS